MTKEINSNDKYFAIGITHAIEHDFLNMKKREHSKIKLLHQTLDQSQFYNPIIIVAFFM